MSLLEPLFALVRNQIKSKDDILVLVTHWTLLKEGYKCIGSGENFPEELPGGSDLLPDDWNANQDCYTLRYAKQDKKLLLKAVPARTVNALCINTMEHPGLTSSCVSLNPGDYVTDEFTDFSRAFKQDGVQKIEAALKNELISKSHAQEKHSPDRPENPSPLLEDPRRQPHPQFRHPRYDWEDGGRVWPPPIGGRDLDPLGRSAGGMIMDPRNFPGAFPTRNPSAGLPVPLPPGAVPPGARFDPFGPPIPGQRNPNNQPRNPRFHGPDPDHLPPPGYDDMFM